MVRGPEIKERLLSLDAFRGLIMVTLVCGGFGFRTASTNHLEVNPESAFWQSVYYHSNHTQWTGCSVSVSCGYSGEIYETPPFRVRVRIGGEIKPASATATPLFNPKPEAPAYSGNSGDSASDACASGLRLNEGFVSPPFLNVHDRTGSQELHPV